MLQGLLKIDMENLKDQLESSQKELTEAREKEESSSKKLLSLTQQLGGLVNASFFNHMENTSASRHTMS